MLYLRNRYERVYMVADTNKRKADKIIINLYSHKYAIQLASTEDARILRTRHSILVELLATRMTGMTHSDTYIISIGPIGPRYICIFSVTVLASS